MEFINCSIGNGEDGFERAKFREKWAQTIQALIFKSFQICIMQHEMWFQVDRFDGFDPFDVATLWRNNNMANGFGEKKCGIS